MQKNIEIPIKIQNKVILRESEECWTQKRGK